MMGWAGVRRSAAAPPRSSPYSPVVSRMDAIDSRLHRDRIRASAAILSRAPCAFSRTRKTLPRTFTGFRDASRAASRQGTAFAVVAVARAYGVTGKVG